MSDEIKTAIEENAVGPASASGDSGSVTQHKLTDQIAADRSIKSKTAIEKNRHDTGIGELRSPPRHQSGALFLRMAASRQAFQATARICSGSPEITLRNG